MTSGWCRWLLTLLLPACVTGKGSQRSMDHKLLLHCNSFGVRMKSGRWPATFILEDGVRGAGAPSHWHSFGWLAPKDHMLLGHAGCQHSFVSEDDKAWAHRTPDVCISI